MDGEANGNQEAMQAMESQVQEQQQGGAQAQWDATGSSTDWEKQIADRDTRIAEPKV